MKHYGLGWVMFQWFLLTLFAYRAQRIVTTDSWPPTHWFHVKLRDRFGTADQSAVSDFFTCGWCFGFFSTLAVFSLATLWLNVPLPVLQAIAATTVVGQLAQRD
jgi:hypothetical protein